MLEEKFFMTKIYVRTQIKRTIFFLFKKI